MKKIINTSGIILLLCYCTQTLSIDTTSIKYYPLKIGNIYVYRIQSSVGPYSSTSYAKVTFPRDTVIYGHKYFYYFSFPDSSKNWRRTDSNSGSLYSFNTGTLCHVNPYDVLIDSLAMRSGNYNCSGEPVVCLGESNASIFGYSTTNLSFEYSIGQYGSSWTYAKNFGFQSTNSWGGMSSYSKTLVGCIINGILYGDTSMHVGIECISNEIPISYNLSQNYPNPFNPVTRIKYDVPANVKGQTANVKLVIYDVLGKEIETLVNQSQKPGSYEVTWDGSRYASGVYFYKLMTEEYIETKKMVLIK